MNLRLNRSLLVRRFDQLAVHKLARHDLTLGRVILTMLSFAFNRGGNRISEVRVACPIGAKAAERGFQILFYLAATPGNEVLQRFVDELVHRAIQYLAEMLQRASHGGLNTEGGCFSSHGW